LRLDYGGSDSGDRHRNLRSSSSGFSADAQLMGKQLHINSFVEELIDTAVSAPKD
jgi:hypothetical protein